MRRTILPACAALLLVPSLATAQASNEKLDWFMERLADATPTWEKAKWNPAG